jgi:hypothetical protein
MIIKWDVDVVYLFSRADRGQNSVGRGPRWAHPGKKLGSNIQIWEQISGKYSNNGSKYSDIGLIEAFFDIGRLESHNFLLGHFDAVFHNKSSKALMGGAFRRPQVPDEPQQADPSQLDGAKRAILLGVSFSGKTTLIRQFSDDHSFIPDEIATKKTLRQNLVQGASPLVQELTKLSDTKFRFQHNFHLFEIESLPPGFNEFKALTTRSPGYYPTIDLGDPIWGRLFSALRTIFAHPQLHEAFDSAPDLHRFPNFRWLMQETQLGHLEDPNWFPSHADWIRSAQMTMNTKLFSIDHAGEKICFVDIPGAWRARNKWIRCVFQIMCFFFFFFLEFSKDMDHFEIFVFTVRLTGYCLRMREDNLMNEMQEASHLFHQMIASPRWQLHFLLSFLLFFRDKKVAVVFTNLDNFEEFLGKWPLEQWDSFCDFKKSPSKDMVDALEFFRQSVFALPDSTRCRHFAVNALDTEDCDACCVCFCC